MTLLQPSDFAGQNWAITPVALAVNEAKPASISNQKWFLVLTGVAIVTVQGSQANAWRRETIHIMPDILAPLRFVMSKHSIPTPSFAFPRFALEQWAPFAALSSVEDKTTTRNVDIGFAVDVWRPHPFDTAVDVNGNQVNQIFNGIVVDVAVRNDRSTLHRISYHITLSGKIALFEPVIL